jgi:signal transduction histidine kinase
MNNKENKSQEELVKRNADLEKIVAQQNKELEIEAALERVRSRSLAMHKSDELNELVAVLFENLRDLQIPATATGIGIYEGNTRNMTCYVCGENEDGLQVNQYFLPYFNHPISNDYYTAHEKELPLFIGHYTKEVKDSFYDYVFSLPDLKFLPDWIRELVMQSDYYSITLATMKHSVININDFEGKPLSEKEIDIVKRFAKVFDQAYTRFLDLQKAEAQAREAEINLAVERVRAKALAMFKSEEILEVAFKLKEEIMGLNIPGVAAANILIQEENGVFRNWDITSMEQEEEHMHLPLDITFEMEQTHPDFYLRKVWNEGDKYTVVTQDLKSLAITTNWLRDHNYTKEADEADHFIKETGIKAVYHPTIPLNKGRMCIDLIDPPEEEVSSILSKMGIAFDLAYKRFEDLQNSEQQLREAKIEAALEKIRSRTMGMQSSEELPEVANLLFLEVQALGIPAWSSGFNILAKDNTSAEAWMSSEGSLQTPFRLRLYGEASFEEMGAFVRSTDTFMVQELGDEELVAHYDYMKSFPDLKPTFDAIALEGLSLPTYQINHLCKFSQGFLLFITYEPVPEAHDIFKRFTKVFEQTYTRFLDLKKAEEQARKAEIDLALERVRAQAMAMKESPDLLDIVVTMRNEFTRLGYEAQYFWHMMWQQDKFEKAMTSGDGTRIGTVMNLPRDFHSYYEGMDDWEKSNEPVHVLAMETDVAIDYVDRMVRLGDFQQIDPNAPTAEAITQIGGLTFVMARTTHGEIGYSLPGVVENPPKEDLEILIRLAKAFDVAHRRFLDLQTSEEQSALIKQEKERLEKTLEELKATQAQLIQSEKLASLGELTAGIAHEIQNPLNFVNNFSEVSSELIDEMGEELDKGDFEEVKAIADDLKQNLEKILHHGKRAEAIVSGMLEHSRASSGEKKATDLNALADEYLRLAYHGLRAKDKSFNADFETDLAENLPKIEVVSQDIGRVLLNLINNAFYAVNEKRKLSLEAYQALVSVSTRCVLSEDKNQNKVEISIKDNGMGIPDSVKEKIFQPFFTTKPTGQGTGLGLSLAYDIIKSHGGKLEVTSTEGEGTEFIIQLPN